MTEIDHKTKTIICADHECRSDFIPQYRGTLLISRYCPDCRYKQAHALRVQRLNVSKLRDAESANLPFKQVVRNNRTSEKSKKKDRRTLDKGEDAELFSKTTNELEKLAQAEFNLWIRNRDRLPFNRFYCPTCDTVKTIDRNYNACHCFPVGLVPALRFNEKNVYGGCVYCNKYQHGSNHTYNDWVRNHIGEEEYQKLVDIKNNNRTGFKKDRFLYIWIIETYKAKNKAYLLEGHQF